MAISLSNLISSKTRKALTLTSGTSWTVPSGVTYVNVTLYGGGGGGGVVTNSTSSLSSGGTGGTTTFTGATSATGGIGGTSLSNNNTGLAPSTIRSGTSAAANTGKGGTAGSGFTGNTENFHPTNASIGNGTDGQIITSIVNTTPGASISYSIGSGGSAGSVGSASGGAGGSGKIEIEYWV